VLAIRAVLAMQIRTAARDMQASSELANACLERDAQDLRLTFARPQYIGKTLRCPWHRDALRLCD